MKQVLKEIFNKEISTDVSSFRMKGILKNGSTGWCDYLYLEGKRKKLELKIGSDTWLYWGF